MAAELKVVPLDVYNFQDPAGTLRRIADEIDSGALGDVKSVGIALFNGKLKAWGAGKDSSAPTIGLLFSAAHIMMANTLVESDEPPDPVEPKPA